MRETMRISILELLCFAIFIALYCALKYPALVITVGDSGLWYYSGKLLLEGTVPYRDFFYAHPPMHILIGALAVLILPITAVVTNILPNLVSIGSGMLLYFIVRREHNDLSAILALIFYLFSLTTLIHSGHFTGMNCAVFFLLLGTMLLRKEHWLWAGVALAASSSTGIYMTAVLPVFLLFAFHRGYSPLRSLILGYASALAIINLPFFLLSPQEYIDQVFLYHLHKPLAITEDQGRLASFIQFWRHNQILLPLAGVVSLISLLPLWRLQAAPKGLIPFAISASAAIGLLLLCLRRLFQYYFLPAVPFFSAIAGIGIAASFRTLGRTSLGRVACAIFGILLFLANAIMSLAPFGQYLKNARWEEAEEVATIVKANLAENETLYGDYTVTSTIALMTGRRIAVNEIDSNTMRFRSGTTDMASVLSKIEEDNVKVLLSIPLVGVSIMKPFQDYAASSYYLAKVFESAFPGHTVMVWKKP